MGMLCGNDGNTGYGSLLAGLLSSNSRACTHGQRTWIGVNINRIAAAQPAKRDEELVCGETSNRHEES